MNPCGSSGEQGGGGSWGTSDNWEHPSGVICQFQGFGGNFQTPARPEWDQWDNAMLFSHNQTAASSTHHHGHIQLEHKPNIFASTPATDLRHYSSCGEFPASTFPQNTLLNELNQTGVRHNFGNFEGMHMQNIPTTQLLPAGMGSGIPGLAATNAMSTDMRAAFDQRHRLFDIMDFEQRNIGDFFKSCEEPYSGVDVQGRIGLNLAMGGRTYFSAEDSVVARLAKRQRFNSPAHVQMPKCQAEGCTADLSRAKHYHRRHKVCELHSKAACVIANGQTQRFCQQCSRFHVLSDFDEAKRSCRKRLADHNRRRRKPQLSTISDENPTAQSLTLKSEEHNIMIQSSKPTVSAADTTSMLLRHFKKTGSPSASTEELNDHRSSALIDFPLNSFSSVRKTDEKPVLKRSFLAGSHNSGTQTSDSQHRVFSAVNSLAPSTSLIDDAARNYSSIHSLQQHGHERMFQHYLQGIPASTGPNLSLSTLTGRNGLGMTARAAGLRQPPTKYYSEEDNIAAATNWRKPEGLLPDFPHESLRSRSSSLEWMSGSISCQEQRQTKRQQLGSISNYLGLNRSGDHIEGHSNILSLSETSPCKDGRNIESAVALEFQALQSDVDADDIMGPQPLKFSDLQSLRPFGSCVYD